MVKYHLIHSKGVKNMKTLIISGSPRKNGDSMTLVNEMIKYLDGEVRIIENL